MKKERPILFPGYENHNSENDKSVEEDATIKPGQYLRIGKPSSRYFQYIYTSLNFSEHNIKGFKALLTVQGLKVVVSSILKLTNGTSYAVLMRKDNKQFLTDTLKIYAEVKYSIKTKELVR